MFYKYLLKLDNLKINEWNMVSLNIPIKIQVALYVTIEKSSFVVGGF